MWTPEEIKNLLLPPDPDTPKDIDEEGMYILLRGESAWTDTSALSLWNNHNVQIRRTKESPQTFEEFKNRLNAGEECFFGVISIWKCRSCKLHNKCKWHKMATTTAKKALAFQKAILDNGGSLLF